MTSAVIFGADGLTGGQIVPCAVGSFFVHAVTKTGTNDEILRRSGAEPHTLDLAKASVDDIAQLFRAVKAQVVVNAASADSHADAADVRAVDCEGALKIVRAMEQAGVQRLVAISAMGVHDPAGMPGYYSDVSCLASNFLWSSSETAPFLRAKWEFEHALHQTGLDFTVLRPGTLFDNADTGCRLGALDLVREGATVSPPSTARVLSAMWPTSRQLLAQTAYACMRSDATIGLTFDVVNGFGDIAEELETMVATRTDVWIADLQTRAWDEDKARKESEKAAEAERKAHPGPKVVWAN